MKSERVKGSLRRFAPLTRGGVVLRAEKKTAAKEGCSRACAQPECASTQNSSNPRERIFFITPQTRTAPGKNAFGYGASASGLTIGEYDQNGAAIREYVWLGSTPIAMFTPDPANAANPPLVYYIHVDHLDTPRVVVDRSDNLRWRWMAEPFGTTAPENNPSGLGSFTQNLRFPGQYADQESGLNYNYFRDYDSSTGRYTQSDPIGLAGGINTYSYVGGNPVSNVDPEGLQQSPFPATSNDAARAVMCAQNPAACPSPPPAQMSCMQGCMLKKMGLMGLHAAGRRGAVSLLERYGGVAVGTAVGIAQSVWTPAAGAIALPYVGFLADQCQQECGLQCEEPPSSFFFSAP